MGTKEPNLMWHCQCCPNWTPFALQLGSGWHEGGCQIIRLDHASPPHGPYCVLDAGHEEEHVYPYSMDHGHDTKGQCIHD